MKSSHSNSPGWRQQTTMYVNNLDYVEAIIIKGGNHCRMECGTKISLFIYAVLAVTCSIAIFKSVISTFKRS